MSRDRARHEPRATLPIERAFVVHFRGSDRRRRRLAGRVEHLASGRSIDFASRRGLLAFLIALLDAPGDR